MYSGATPKDMVMYFEKRLKLPPVVESFSKLFNEVMPALSSVTRQLVEQVRGFATTRVRMHVHKIGQSARISVSFTIVIPTRTIHLLDRPTAT